MPKLTNNHNLPESIRRAIENDPYDAGDCDISTTQLIDTPQVVTLKLRHGDKITEDISERIWSLLGQSIHVILERAAPDQVIAEKRYFAKISGWTISGAVDLIDHEQTLVDYKVTSVFTFIYGSRLTDWTAQANVNRWLYHKNGGEVKKAQNILFLRDWAPSKAGIGNYPAVQVVTIDLPLWTISEAAKYIKERVALHQAARTKADHDLPECSDEERWLNKGVYKRCERYCAVRSVCCQNLKLTF